MTGASMAYYLLNEEKRNVQMQMYMANPDLKTIASILNQGEKNEAAKAIL